MSTKTTFKRIALVTVAALGLGVLATVPSQATVQAGSLTLSSTTSTQLTDETSTASAAVATISFLNGAVAAADSVSVTAYLMSAPAGNTAVPVLQVSETTSAQVDDQAVFGAPLAAGEEVTSQVVWVSGTAANSAVTAKFKVYMNSATKAGAYVVKLVPAVSGGGGVIDTTGVTLTITVSTNPATDVVAASATSIISGVALGDTATTSDQTVTGSNSITTLDVEVAYIQTTLKNAAGLTTVGESYTAIITGAGQLGSNPLTNAYTDGSNRGRAITVKAGDAVAVYADGSSGTGTITIQSKAGKVLATKTVTFFGDVASATSKVVKSVVGTADATDAVLISLKDAAGTNISTSSVTFYVTSSDTTKISGTYASQAVTYSATNLVGGVAQGAGYLIDLTGVAAGTASVTIGTKSSATATTGVNAAPVSIRVGSTTPASVEVTLDKTAYVPGEKATITVVLKDKDGLTLADGRYASIFATGGIAASYSLGAGSDTTTSTDVIAFANGKQTYTVYMPVTDKDVKFSWTTGAVAGTTFAGLATANQSKAGSVTVTLTSSAIEAANAATTAALAANDAVDALAATVAKLVANLKAQITALTKLIVKIQKKVGA